MSNFKIGNDYLYVGDGGDDSVTTFDAETGRFLGSFVAAGSNGLHGPRGLIFDHNHDLLVVNQNVNQPQNGNVLKYDGQTGAFLGQLVNSNSVGAPFAPRGIVLSKRNILYVADVFNPSTGQGEVRTYKGNNGEFLGNLDYSGFNGAFHPRGLVFGPDGLLYVSVFDINDDLKGWVLRFDSKKGEFRDVFIESNNFNNLHRPEGLVFGPDGNLYVTSFRSDENDTDKILIFDGDNGKFLRKIDLYSVGQPRAFAQALLFGPDGKLFVPITGDGPATGSVRRYNVNHKHKKFDVFVPPASAGGPIGSGWFLTFGNTNPSTLEYGRKEDDESSSESS